MSHFGAHVHTARTIFPLNVEKNKVLHEMNASKPIWSHWFRQGKAFAHVDKRSYAQVLRSTSVDNTVQFMDKQRPVQGNSRSKPLLNTFPVNKVVNLTVTKSKQSNHRPSGNGAKHESNTGEVTTVMSAVTTQQSFSTVPDNKVDALPNTDQHLLIDSYLDPPTAGTGFEPTYANTATPLPVWENRNFCTDYNRCVAQNGDVFGALSITDQIVYQGPPTNNASVSDILELHSKIRHSRPPNFLGCRILIKGQLNPHVWREYLSDYWDKQLPDLIDYGFPIDFDRTCPLLYTDKNHSSAQQFSRDIELYLDNEVAYNAMYGPFTEKPINMHISPLNQVQITEGPFLILVGLMVCRLTME